MIIRKSNSIKVAKISEAYHKILKIEAAKKGMSLLEYSRFLAKMKKEEDKEKEKNGFTFGF